MFRPFPTRSDALKGYGVSISMLLVWCASTLIPAETFVQVKPIAEFSSTIPIIPPEQIKVLAEVGGPPPSEMVEEVADEGSYVPVEEPRDQDMPRIQTTEHMSDPDWTDPTNVIGQDPGGRSRFRVNVPVATEEPVPEDPQVAVVEKEPVVDMASLRDAIQYPEQAKRIGVEGTVVVRALIDANGRIKQAEIYASDHAMLENAALDGVRKARFTPAEQNGRNVPCWVYVPVSFRLR